VNAGRERDEGRSRTDSNKTIKAAAEVWKKVLAKRFEGRSFIIIGEVNIGEVEDDCEEFGRKSGETINLEGEESARGSQVVAGDLLWLLQSVNQPSVAALGSGSEMEEEGS